MVIRRVGSYTRRWSFQSKSRRRKNKRTAIPKPFDIRVQSTKSPDLDIFLPYSNYLIRATKSHCEPCTSGTGFFFGVIPVYREETRCCTSRDQRRDAVERVGCDNTICRRAARIYHGVATSKHQRIFRLLGERWDGVGAHRRKGTVQGHSPERRSTSTTSSSMVSLTYIHSD